MTPAFATERLENLIWPQERQPYSFEPQYVAMGAHATPRRCYVHPLNVAIAWERNQSDNSYKRPVCEGCAQ